jgi:ElaB/YqjD/DUF883 family membrane-anchored ribosome-binding protein
MTKTHKNIKTLSEAIDHLEKAGKEKSNEFKNLFGQDFQEIKEAIEELKPHFEKIKTDVEEEAKKTKSEIEEKVKQNPWLALGIVGLIAFFIGWLMGNSRK